MLLLKLKWTTAHPIRSARDLARFLSPQGMYSHQRRTLKTNGRVHHPADDAPTVQQSAGVIGTPQPARRAGNNAPCIKRREEERRLHTVLTANVTDRREQMLADQTPALPPC